MACRRPRRLHLTKFCSDTVDAEGYSMQILSWASRSLTTVRYLLLAASAAVGVCTHGVRWQGRCQGRGVPADRWQGRCQGRGVPADNTLACLGNYSLPYGLSCCWCCGHTGTDQRFKRLKAAGRAAGHSSICMRKCVLHLLTDLLLVLLPHRD
jgi:hypothetical protein